MIVGSLKGGLPVLSSKILIDFGSSSLQYHFSRLFTVSLKIFKHPFKYCANIKSGVLLSFSNEYLLILTKIQNIIQRSNATDITTLRDRIKKDIGDTIYQGFNQACVNILFIKNMSHSFDETFPGEVNSKMRREVSCQYSHGVSKNQ